MRNDDKQIYSFEDLKVWQCSRDLQKRISQVVKTFPKSETYRLADQMIRSSRSVARNIAEGYGRYHFQENIQFCRQSRGSLTELLNDLITAYDEKYITQEKLNDFRNDIELCHKLLNGYISYLKKAKNEYRTKEDSVIYKYRKTQ